MEVGEEGWRSGGGGGGVEKWRWQPLIIYKHYCLTKSNYISFFLYLINEIH